MKFAQVKEMQLLKAMKSPRKRKALLRSGISFGKQKSKEVSRLMSALAKVKSYVTELKTSNTKSSRLKKRTVARALCGTTPKMWLSTQTGLSRAFMLKASLIPEEEHELKQTRASTVSAEEKIEIVEFYNRPEIRVVTPDRTLKSLHCDYKQETGSVIGRTTFQKLRPKTTLCVDQAKHTSCLCEYCTNVALKLSVFRANNIDLGDAYDVTMTTLYAKEGDWHNPSCIYRDCKNCGVDNLDNKLQGVADTAKIVKWKFWGKSVDDGKARKILLEKRGTLKEMALELKKELEIMSTHLFNAHWQYKQFRQLKLNLPVGCVLTLEDFAENYRCVYQDEVQSAHWSYEQVTLFTTVSYYKCTDCSEVVTESVTFITPDLCHDAAAVKHFNASWLQHLDNERNVHPSCIVQFTDGCAQQFKSKQPFLDLTCTDIPTTRCFFGSRHGKGPCAGVGAVAKQVVGRAVNGGQVVIQDAKDMAVFLQNTYSNMPSGCVDHKISAFIYVPWIDRSQGDKASTAVKGTRKLHQVKAGGPGVLLTRALACFCPKCIEGKGECDNLLYTKQWQMHTLSKNVHQRKPVCFDTLSMQLNEACTYADLEVVCRQHSHLASQHPLGITSLSAADPVFKTDVNAASAFPKDTSRLTPLAIVGDGNCLPRCASVLVYGDQGHYTEMRARIILGLVLAQECYLDESFLQDGNIFHVFWASGSYAICSKFCPVCHAGGNYGYEESISIHGDLAITCLGQHCRRSPVFTVPGLCRVPRSGAPTQKNLSPTRIDQRCAQCWNLVDPQPFGNLTPRNGLPNHFVVCVTPMEDMGILFIIFDYSDIFVSNSCRPV